MPDEIIEVVVDTTTIEVVVEGGLGPAGPTGPQGPPGPSGQTFTQPFTNTNVVSVQHDLGYKPAVSVLVSGEEIEVDVTHSSNNALSVSWNNAVLSGEVVCS